MGVVTSLSEQRERGQDISVTGQDNRQVSVSAEKSLIGPDHHAQRIYQQFVDVTGRLCGS